MKRSIPALIGALVLCLAACDNQPPKAATKADAKPEAAATAPAPAALTSSPAPSSPAPTETPTVTKNNASPSHAPAGKVVKSDEEWQKTLTPEQYLVARKQHTERPFSSPLDHEFRPGDYYCAACGAHLFSSETKFDSGCGWPAFYKALAGDRIGETVDRSHGMVRTEVHCNTCGAHLGHVFDDSPQTPTGQRYCINGVVLKFVPREPTSTTPAEKK
jgi:peptide-methionine (R)-S-oxide reductase